MRAAALREKADVKAIALSPDMKQSEMYVFVKQNYTTLDDFWRGTHVF